MIGGHHYGLSWMYVFNLRGLLDRKTYLRIEVKGEITSYSINTIDWNPFDIIRGSVASIDHDGSSSLWPFLGE